MAAGDDHSDVTDNSQINPDVPNGEKNNFVKSEVPVEERISFPILADVTAAQAAHGLKHSDYERYRQYCTRRISRLRSATELTNRHGNQVRKYAERAVTPADVVRDPRALCIPLASAERDWAAAMSAKRDAATAASGPHRARRVTLSHLRRAARRAGTVAELARAAADEDTLLEAEAYYQSMYATAALERESWSVALTAFEIAHKIYTGMAGVRSGTSAATLYERKLEEIAQAVRFCKYNLARANVNSDTQGESGDEEGAALLQRLRSDAADAADAAGGPNDLSARIEAALVEARRRAAQSFGHVTWCGVDVALRSERVREAVLTAQEETKAFDQVPDSRDIDTYDKLFVTLSDTIKVVADERREFEASTGTSDSRVVELEYILAFLTHIRLQHTIDRNLLLVDSLRARRASKPEDFVRLYDNLIANVTDVLALKGVDTDAAMANNAEAQRTLFKAHRCFHLAQCYHATHLEKEAAALFDRVTAHAATLSGHYAEEAQIVVQESSIMKYRARAQAFLDELRLVNNLNGVKLEDSGDIRDADSETGGNDGSEEKSSNATQNIKMMVDHLDLLMSFAPDENKADVAICHLPPALEPVPCKPVLFDLAIDGLRLPSEGDDVKTAKEEEAFQEDPKPEKPKPTGFAATRLGRWWTGGGS